MKTRHIVLLAGALLLAAPAITTLTGCGGGNSGINLGNQNLSNLPLVFGNGQSGQLDLALASGVVTAVLRVDDPTPLAREAEKAGAISAQALPIIPAGTYTGTGTADSSGNFTLTFDSPDPTPNITITGNIPTTSSAGSYTITIGTQSVSGVFPSIVRRTPTPTGTPGSGGGGSPTFTPTPNGTATPIGTPTSSADRIDGSVSGLQNANLTAGTFSLPLKFSSVSTTGERVFTGNYEDRSGTLFRSVTFEVRAATALAAGQSFGLAGGATSGSLNFFEAQNSNPSGTAKNWDSTSGTLRIDSIQGDIIRFTITNARLVSRQGSLSTGSFTVNASGQARSSFGAG